MPSTNILPLGLGLVIFSFLITSISLVPFINFLYKLHFIRHKESELRGRKLVFDKFHDKKAGTPVGGGILLISIVGLLFTFIFPLVSFFGVYVQTSFPIRFELITIFFTFISFGFLGLVDDLIKTFGKPTGSGPLGKILGLNRNQKFIAQWILAFIISFFIYRFLGIHILHLPFINKVFDLGVFYIPFAAFLIVFFTNAFNFTDGLDGLSSGLLMIYLLAFAIIAATNLDTPLSIFISLWLGAVIAFLYFNVWPARIFLGDAGALSFGSMIAVIGLLTGSIAGLFIIGGIFVIEAASSGLQIVWYKVFNKPLLPLAPIHHTFLVLGWEEPKIVMRAWIAGVILAIFGLWLSTI